LSCLAAVTQTVTAAGLVRVPAPTVRMPADPPLAGYSFTNALPGLTFDQPVAIAAPPGETNRLFIVERTGRIMVVSNLAAPTKSVFLDLTANLLTNNLEAGLLGLAFHPGYATNRYFFVFRTVWTTTPGYTNTVHDQVSRFEASPVDPNIGLPESESVVLAVHDDVDVHNAGDLAFGPDGYLYVSVGDSGPPPELWSANKQPLDRSLFGGILRIDVDKRPDSLPPNPGPAVTTNYAIPPDNPFVGVTNYQGFALDPAQVRTEFYALGLRNPWRMAFDPVTGELYVADVGASYREEIDLVVKGGNYGWPYLEADLPTLEFTNAPPAFAASDPLIWYAHGNDTNEGTAVIGGVVYRGAAIPQLAGSYLFGDFNRGNVWALRRGGSNAPAAMEWLAASPGISTFGRDPRDGEVLVANFRSGTIQRLVFVPPEAAPAFPQTLAETGLFLNLTNLTPAPGVVAYEINVPFWSDGALKQRWFSLPDTNAAFGFNADQAWSFPTGTVWVKHFELELTNGVPASRRRLETRVIVRNAAGIYGVTYRWGESHSNAFLVHSEGLDETFVVEEGGIQRTQVWHYPRRSECRSCHSAPGGFAPGFTTAQLNRAYDYDGVVLNQLDALRQAGYLAGASTPPAELRALASAHDPDFPLQYRARSFLNANCAPCHWPGSLAALGSAWDPRVSTPLADAGLLDNRVITPRSVPASDLIFRLMTSDAGRMPPISSTVQNQSAIGLMIDWVNSFPPAPWTASDIGPPGWEGSSAMTNWAGVVSGTGTGLAGTGDRFHFLRLPMTGNGQIIARLVSARPAGPGARAGITLRNSADPYASHASLLASPEGGLEWVRRTQTGAETVTNALAAPGSNLWIRLVREGPVVTAYQGGDGTNWFALGTEAVGLQESIFAGLVSASGSAARYYNAAFEEIRASGIELSCRTGVDGYTAGTPLTLTARVAAHGVGVRQVEFVADGAVIGSVTNAPFSIVWSNATAGRRVVVARLVDEAGATVSSAPVTLEIGLPDSLAASAGFDDVTLGNWRGVHGANGWVLPAGHTNLGAGTTFELRPGTINTLPSFTADPRALESPSGGGREPVVWTSPTNVSFDLRLGDGLLHRVVLYFVDWEMMGQRIQTIEVTDAASGEVLDSRTISAFSGGKYLLWHLRGHVRFRITSENGLAVTLSGLFVDPGSNQPPSLAWVEPGPAESFVAPANVLLRVKCKDPDGVVRKVEFILGDEKIGEATAPFGLIWSNAPAGIHEVLARPVDNLGQPGRSMARWINIGLPSAGARFLRSDETTQGNWPGAYGADGHAILFHATNPPAYGQFEIRDAGHGHWAATPDDPRGLVIGGGERAATHWHSPTNLTIDVRLTDGRAHQLALYFIDWSGSRRQLVQVIDAATGAVLDSREAGGFFNTGRYFVWSVRGHVQFRLTRIVGQAIFSGIFFDSFASPRAEWAAGWFGPQERANPLMCGDAADPDGDQLPNLVEYALGSNPLAPEPDVKPRVELREGRLWITYRRSTRAPDVTFTLDHAASLGAWEPADAHFEAVDALAEGERETVVLRARDPIVPGAAGFYRLRVRPNEP
jgi:glucose/arabinose dehydrogenase